jgi:predicted SAM-dependent methyltransferase
VKALTIPINISSLLRIMRHALREIRQDVQRSKMRQKGMQYAHSLTQRHAEIKLDLGCSFFKRPDFIGIDLSQGADIRWDLHWGLPFDDNRVLEIRSDHFFEHLELPIMVEVLRECRRVLRPGGVLDFTVPHLDPYMHAYLQRDWQFLREKITDVPQGQEDLYSTCFDRIAWLLHRAGEHKALFDRESIIAKLRVAGFTDIKTREFEPNRDMNWRFSSIYVVAVK